MKYVYKADPRRFARYFNRVWEMEYDTYDVEGMILEGIERQKQFYVSVGIPVHYSELGVKEEDIPTVLHCPPGTRRHGRQLHETQHR